MIPNESYEVFNNVPMTCYRGVKDTKLFLVHTMHEFHAFYEILMTKRRCACDVESNGFRWYAENRIIGMSFGWGVYNFYLPVRHQASILGGDPPSQLDMDEIRPYLQKFFARKDVITLWSNGKFDRHFYKADGIDIQTPFHDTILMWKQVDENAPAALKTVASGWKDKLGLWHKGLVDPKANADEKLLSEWRAQEAKARKRIYTEAIKARCEDANSEIRFQGWKKNDVKKYIKENELLDHPYREVGKDNIHYGYIPVIDMVKYAALDTYLTYCVYEHCLPLIESNKKIANIYKNELLLSLSLFESEHAGICVDIPYMSSVEEKLTKELDEKRHSLYEKLGKIEVVTKKATKKLPEVKEWIYPKLTGDQLAQALIENLGIKLVEQTDDGAWKLDKKVLTKLSKKYPVCKEILEYRKFEKLLTTYVRNVINSAVNGILYSSFNQSGAKTGRMSSSGGGSGGINLQNIPGRDKTVKKAFTVPEDYIGIYIDYSQVEVRMTAHFSQDPVLLDAYKTGKDVHLSIASGMFGLDYVEAKSIHKNEDHARWKEINEIRQVGKVLGFGSIYQVSPPGLSEQIPRPSKYADLTQEEWINVCADFLDKFFETHRHVKKFIIRSNRFVRANGFMENYFGRVRHLPEYQAVKVTGDDSKFWMHTAAERQGTNFLVQGTCADVYKMSVVKVAKLLKGKKSRIINHVHDEMSFYIHKSEMHLVPEIKRIMEDWDFSVPLVADVSWSKTNWADKRGIDGNNLEELMKLVA